MSDGDAARILQRHVRGYLTRTLNASATAALVDAVPSSLQATQPSYAFRPSLEPGPVSSKLLIPAYPHGLGGGMQGSDPAVLRLNTSGGNLITAASLAALSAQPAAADDPLARRKSRIYGTLSGRGTNSMSGSSHMGFLSLAGSGKDKRRKSAQPRPQY